MSDPDDSAPEPGLMDLLRSLVDDTRRLVRDEIALARSELNEKARLAARQSLLMFIGAVLALFASFALLAACTLALAHLLTIWTPREAALWLAPLAMAIVSAAVGAILLHRAIARLRADGLVPTRTLESMRDSGRLFKDRLQ